MRIAGKLAVVTGAAVGTGRAIAERLAAEGASVVLADVNEEDGLRAQRAIGDAARFERVDLGDDRQLEALMSCEPRILVNNAGGGPNLCPTGSRPNAPSASWRGASRMSLWYPWKP